MIAIVDNSFICKKYLPDGILKQFKPILKGCFYQECQIGPIELALSVEDSPQKSVVEGVTLDRFLDRPSATLSDGRRSSLTSPMFGKKLRLKSKHEKTKFDLFIESYNKFASFTGAAS